MRSRESADESHPDNGLSARWSPVYRPEWDDDPGRYITDGLVAWGRSRRLARFDDPQRAFKAYLGVQHYDPVRWNVAGLAKAKYFLSLFLANRTLALRTFATVGEAMDALRTFHHSLGEPPDR